MSRPSPLAVLLTLVAVLGLLAPAATARQPDRPATPANDAARGLVFDGLVPAAADSRCAGGFAFAAPGLADHCTHGPDAGPPGVDVRVAQAAPLTTEAAAAAGDLVCDGDGTSGFRAEAIYVVLEGNASRFAQYEESFRAWAATIQQEIAASTVEHDPAAEPLHYRFVHTPTAADGTCELVIHQVTLSQAADDSFNDTITELQALGFDDPTRNYQIWMDANRLCGIGTLYGDSRPDPNQNYNNIGFAASYSRSDAGCWGYAETHELMHNIGAVQNDAPNASGGYHCNDDRDIMCYADGGSTSALFTDPDCSDGRFENLLDCNGDDYFNPSPVTGSYLDTHWNTADSAWLFTASGGGGGDPTPSAPIVLDDAASVDEGASVTVDVLANDSDADGDLDASTLRIAEAPTVGTASVGGGGITYDAAGVVGAATVSIGYEVCDAGGRCGAAVLTVQVIDVPSPDDPVVETFTGSMNKKNPSVSFPFTTGATGDIVVRFDDGSTTTAGAPPPDKGGGGKGGGGKGGGDSSGATVELLRGGEVVATSTGSGVVTFTALDQSAGEYVVRVSGGKGGFTLTVEHR